MSEVREATERLLSEKPDIKPTLREILRVDEDQESWDFHDISAESGVFGEIVSKGIVEQSGDGYTVANRTAVAAALGEEIDSTTDSEGANKRSLSLDFAVPTVDFGLQAKFLIGALVSVIILRAYTFPSVFRKGDVVLGGNDPYFVRYSLNQHLVTSTSTLDLGTIATSVTSKNSLFRATIWWVTELLGGAVHTGGVVLAVYPVVSAVITALLIYSITKRLTQDWRIAILSVVMLAVLPAHAYRTTLGFGDHHAFDYIWIALIAYALVLLADHRDTSLQNWEPWTASAALGAGVGGYTLSWIGSPILLIMIALYVAILTPSIVRADRPPMTNLAPLAVGLAIATGLVGTAFVTFGWANIGRLLVVSALFAGTTGLALIAEVVHRLGIPTRVLVGVEVGAGIIGVVILSQVPVLGTYVQRGLGYFQKTASLQIAETISLLGGNPVMGPLYLFGMLIIVAFPVLVWASYVSYRRHNPGWLVLVTFGWYLIILTWGVQRRFAGELSLFIAVFTAIGFVYLAAKIDLIDTPHAFDDTAIEAPQLMSELQRDRTMIIYFVILFMFVAGMSIMQTGIYTGYITTDDEKHDAARWMDQYETERGWEYPDNYVFSQWDKNRVYNYFVSWDEPHPKSLWYGYARNNYIDFLESSAPDEWYQKLRQHGTGFIVTTAESEVASASMQDRLHERFGSATQNTPGVAHYRALYASEDESLKVFTLVPGATIRGSGSPGQSITVMTNVTIENAAFSYTRYVRTNATGDFNVTVPYPGTYTVAGSTVQVTRHQVQNGSTIPVQTG